MQSNSRIGFVSSMLKGPLRFYAQLMGRFFRSLQRTSTRIYLFDIVFRNGLALALLTSFYEHQSVDFTFLFSGRSGRCSFYLWTNSGFWMHRLALLTSLLSQVVNQFRNLDTNSLQLAMVSLYDQWKYRSPRSKNTSWSLNPVALLSYICERSVNDMQLLSSQ